MAFALQMLMKLDDGFESENLCQQGGWSACPFCRVGPFLMRMTEAVASIFFCQWEDKLQTESLGLSPLQGWGSRDALIPILNQEHWGYLDWQTQGTQYSLPENKHQSREKSHRS